MVEKRVQKLTVTDIVNECHITRQAFYYHFSDIPDLLQWMLRQKEEEALEESRRMESGEERIRYWLLIAINANAYVKKGTESNYADELWQMIFQRMQSVFSSIMETEETFSTLALTPFEKDLLIQYNCHAMAGLMRNWTEKETENVDRIVHCIYQFVTGQLTRQLQ